MNDLIGQSLGRYEIRERLGEGGMAVVYKAHDTRLERDVAVKVIRTERLTLETMGKTLKRFEREAKALAKLTHPNIVPITDYGEHDGKPYLVMPYLPGGTLKQQLKGKPMPWEEAVRLLIPIARALHYAHQQGIIHRDVKPSNILITQSGEPMLTDFGIAKILLDTEETADLTGTGLGVGTPEYMSPEQFQGKGVDARTDIYSLGVVLYEMITGRKPYQADTPAAVLIKQVTEALPRPRSFIPELPDEVEKVLLKALARNKEDRYQDVSEFSNGLEALSMEIGKGGQFTKSTKSRKVEKTRSDLRNVSLQEDPYFQQSDASTYDDGETALLSRDRRAFTKDNGTELTLHNLGWGAVFWIMLIWALGMVIAGLVIELGDKFEIIDSDVSVTIGIALETAFIGFFTGLIFKKTTVIVQWRSVFWVTLVWICVFALAAVLAGKEFAYRAEEGFAWIYFSGAGLIGGFALGLVLRRENTLRQWKSLILISWGLMAGAVVILPQFIPTLIAGPWYGMLEDYYGYFNVPTTANVLVAVISQACSGLIGGAIFGSMMVWQLRGEREKLDSEIPIKLSVVDKLLLIASSAFVALFFFYASFAALQPCGWLDKSLKISGCVQNLLWWDKPTSNMKFSPDGHFFIYGTKGLIISNPLTDVGAYTPMTDISDSESEVNSIVFSPDGTLLVAYSLGDGTVMIESGGFAPFRMFDENEVLIGSGQGLSNLTPLWSLDAHISGDPSLVFSSDGALLATASMNDSIIQVWRVSDGGLLQSFESLQAKPIGFSPNASALIAVDELSTIRILDVISGKELGNIDAKWVVDDLAFSPDGKLLAVGNRMGTIVLWDLTVMKEVTTFRLGHEFQTLTFSPVGELLAVGSYGKIELFDLNGTKENTFSDWFMGMVNGLAFSPDGTQLATVSEKAMRIWEIEPSSVTGISIESPAATAASSPAQIPTPLSLAGTPYPYPQVAISPENADRVEQLARWGKGSVEKAVFSPDGRLLAVASSIGIYLYDPETLIEVRYIETEAEVNAVAFSLDGQTLVSGGYGETVQLWRVSDGSLLRTLEGYTNYVDSVAFSPDGQTVAAGDRSNIVRLWRVSDGILLNTLEEHTDMVRSVAFSPDGEILASGSDDHTIRLWRVSDGTFLRSLDGHTDSVWSVTFSPDGATLASGADDQTVRLWRVSDGALLRTLEGHTRDVDSVAFSPDGQTLASASWDDSVRLWQVSDGVLLRTFEGHTSSVNSVVFSPDGQTLASASSDDSVRLWRVSDGTMLRTLEGSDWVRSVAFSPDGTTLASGSDDNTVRLWRVSDGTMSRTLEGSDWVWSVAFSPDGQTLASATWGDTVQLWRVFDGTPLYTLEGHTDFVQSVAFSPDGQILASASWDDTVRLWRVSDGVMLRTLEGHTEFVKSLDFSPDGQILAGGAGDNTVRLWRVSDGTLLQTLEGHTDAVWSVAFSPDGQTLASISQDNFVWLWRVSDGTLLQTWWGGRGDVAFSPDGQTLASGSWSDVRLWRVSDGTLLHTLEGHRGQVTGVAFSPDGTLLVSGSSDGTVRLWGGIP